MIKNLEAEKDDLNKNLRLAQSKTNEIKDDAKTIALEQLLENKGTFFANKSIKILYKIIFFKKIAEKKKFKKKEIKPKI